MRIYIPSRARAENQLTVLEIPKRWRPKTALVVPKGEGRAYTARALGVAVLETPKTVQGIGPTRHWILKNCPENKCLMLDDDLGFLIRRTDEPAHFLGASPEQVDAMLRAVEKALDKFPHAGVCTREGGNRLTEGDVVCTRLLRALAFRTDVYRETRARFDRIPVMEDFDVALQLLRAGHPSLLLTRWAQGQQQSGAPGGCSEYRNKEVQATAARELARLHAPFVKVVQKTTKGSFGGGTRTDVVVYWKKAFLSSGRELPDAAY